MNPDAQQLWRGPRWALAVLLAVLGMLGPFSIDTYIPAFSGIAGSLGATPLQMQQTLSAYLFGFAFMSLFHGAIVRQRGAPPRGAVGHGRVHAGLRGLRLVAKHRAADFLQGHAGADHGRGHCGGARGGARHVPPSQAQRVMSQITIYFGVAPAIAPLIGGWLFVHLDWHSIFWFLAAVGVALWIANYKLLPKPCTWSTASL